MSEGATDRLIVDIEGRLDSLERSMADAERLTAQGGQRAGAAFGEGYRRNSEGRLIDAQGRFVAEGERVGQAAGEAAGRKFGSVFSDAATAKSQMFAGILTGIAGGALASGTALVKMAGDMEMSQTAFTTLLGSGQKAKAFLVDLQQFAANTPFEFNGLQDSAKKLLAFGFSAQQVVPMLTAVGDAVGSLGGGKDVLDGVTMALGQMQAKGKVSAEEMNQLAERGIPAWDMLAKKIGVSIPEAMKMAQDGAISSAQAIPAILQGMEDKFGGGMAAQSKTLLGMWSNTMDTMQQAGIKAGQVIIDAFDLKTKLGGLNEFISSVPELLARLDLKRWAADNSDAITAVGGAVLGALVPALAAGAVAAAGFIAPLLPFIAAGAAIALVAKNMGITFDDVRRSLADLGGQLRQAGGNIQQSMAPALENMRGLFTVVGQTVRDVFAHIIKPVAEALAPAFQQAWQAMAPVFNTLVEVVKDVFKTVDALVKGDWSGAWDAAKNAVGQALLAIQGTLSGLGGAILTALRGVNTLIDNKAEELAGNMRGLGKRMLEGFMGGFDGLKAILLNAISQAMQAAADKLPEMLRGPFQAAANAAAQAAARSAQDAAGHRINSAATAANFGPVTGINSPGLVSTSMMNTPNADRYAYSYISGLKDVFKNDPQVASDCASIASSIMHNLGQNIKGSVNAGILEQNAIKAGYQKVEGEEVKPGDLVIWTSGNGKTYGMVSGKHAGVGAGMLNGRPMVIDNPGQRNTVVEPMFDRQNATIYRAPNSPFAQAQQPVTNQPKTANIADVFGGGTATPTPDPQTLKDYQLTLKDWNALQGKALDLAHQLKKAEDERNYSAQVTLQGEIKAWEGTNKARAQAFSLAQKIVSEQAKGGDGPITTAQIVKAQQLTAALEKATKAHDPRAIDAAKTAMDLWSKASEGNARALSAVQSAQSGLKKSAGEYVATQGDLIKYGDKALVLIKAQEAAQKSGDAARILSANNALKAFEGQGKAQAAVIQIEQAAYQNRKSLADKASADAKKAREDAASNAEAASKQADQLASKAAAGSQEAARIRLDSLRTSQAEAQRLAGDDLEKQLAVQQAFAPKIKAAAEAEALAVLQARKLANEQWKEQQEEDARKTITDQGQLKVRLGEIENGWRTENSNAYKVYYAALNKAANDSARSIEDASKKVAAASLQEAAALQQGIVDSEAALQDVLANPVGERTDRPAPLSLDQRQKQEFSDLYDSLTNLPDDIAGSAAALAVLDKMLQNTAQSGGISADQLKILQGVLASTESAASELAQGLEDSDAALRDVLANPIGEGTFRPDTVGDAQRETFQNLSNMLDGLSLDVVQNVAAMKPFVDMIENAGEHGGITTEQLGKLRAQVERLKVSADSANEVDVPISALEKAANSAVEKVDDLVASFQNGEITGKEFAKQVADSVPTLERMAKAAQAAGNTDLAQDLTNVILALKGLVPASDAAAQKLEKVTNKINEFGQYGQKLIPVVTGFMQMLGGTTSDVADEWASDLANMTNDLVTFGTQIASGNWVGAAITGLSTIFGWFSRNKKAAEEAAKATADYNKQFQFSDNGYGTRTVTKYTTGILFWRTDHYKEQVDETKKDLALAVEGGFVNGFKNGFADAIAKNDFGVFKKDLKTSVGQAVLEGLEEAFIKGEVIKNILGPAIDDYLKDPNAPGAQDRLNTAIDKADSVSEVFFNNVLKPIAERFDLLGTEQAVPTASEGGISSGTPGSTPGIQTVKVEMPSVSASFNFNVLSTLSTVVERAAPRIEAASAGLQDSAGVFVACTTRLERLLAAAEYKPDQRALRGF